MILVDANIFLRHLIQPVTDQDRASAMRAAALFRQAEEASVEITTSEAVLAEVVFILSHPRHYSAQRPDVRFALQNLLRARGFKLANLDVCLYALDIWVDNPKLSFPDALCAATCELRGLELATFDVVLSQTPNVRPYDFNQGD